VGGGGEKNLQSGDSETQKEFGGKFERGRQIEYIETGGPGNKGP